MKARLYIDNTLVQIADELEMKRNTIWSDLKEHELADFPKLAFEDLKTLTLGTYQIRQLMKYSKEHMSETGEYKFQINKNHCIQGLVRAKIQSRHIGTKCYTVYIEYEPNGEGYESIKRYMCRYKSGLRTVGMCSHITSFIWYLSIGRHQKLINNSRMNIEEMFDTNEIDEVEENE